MNFAEVHSNMELYYVTVAVSKSGPSPSPEVQL